MNVYMANLKIVGTSTQRLIGSARTIYILTDTFQNACSIARAKCQAGEEVVYVSLDNENVIIDYATMPQDDC